jgi:hypothetical protein
LDTADPKTNSEGNLAEFWVAMPTAKKVDFWAWTASPSTVYNNLTHGSTAQKVTVESYP